MSQRRQDRKLSNIRATKKICSSPKTKNNKISATKDSIFVKNNIKIHDNIEQEKTIIKENINAEIEAKTDNLDKEVDENSRLLGIKEEPQKANSDIKDFMATQSADRQSLNSSVVTDSINETRIKATNNPMDLIAEYRNTITERYAHKILDKSGIQNRSFQNKNNISQKPKVVKQNNAISSTSFSRETRNTGASLTNPHKRYKSCKKVNKETALIDNSKKESQKNKMHKHRGSLDSPIKVSINDADNHVYLANKKRVPK